MHLLRHRVRPVEELLAASVVDAQDVPADVGDFLVMMEVGHFLSKHRNYMMNELIGWPLLFYTWY